MTISLHRLAEILDLQGAHVSDYRVEYPEGAAIMVEDVDVKFDRAVPVSVETKNPGVSLTKTEEEFEAAVARHHHGGTTVGRYIKAESTLLPTIWECSCGHRIVCTLQVDGELGVYGDDLSVQVLSRAEALVKRPLFEIDGEFWNPTDRAFYKRDATGLWAVQTVRSTTALSDMMSEVSWHALRGVTHGKGLVWTSHDCSYWECPCGFKVFINVPLDQNSMREVQGILGYE